MVVGRKAEKVFRPFQIRKRKKNLRIGRLTGVAVYGKVYLNKPV